MTFPRKNLCKTVGMSSLTCQPKAVLPPVCIRIDFGSDNLLHKVLWIRAMDIPSPRVRPIRHVVACKLTYQYTNKHLAVTS